MIKKIFILLSLSGLYANDFNESAPFIKEDRNENNTSKQFNISNVIKNFQNECPSLKTPVLLKREVDTKEFKGVWNKVVSRIKYDNTHLKINFDKYKLGKAPQKDLSKYLSFDHQHLESLKGKLESSQNTFMISPFIKWVDKKMKVSYIKPSKKFDSGELMQYVSNIVNPGKPFSSNTIDTVVQLNEFCYYFERNKDRFYREGYTRNVKSCRKIEKILKDTRIKINKKKGNDMNADQIWKIISIELPKKIKENPGLNAFVNNRAKFEGWLKVEISNILSQYGIVVPEQDKIDIVFDQIIAIELKTPNTNYRYMGIMNKGKPITDNINSIIKDINTLQTTSYPQKTVLFIAFPLELPNKRWEKHLNKITSKLQKYYSVEIVFENGKKGMLYFGII